MEYHFYDFVGNAGVVLILGTYLLVQLRKLDATGNQLMELNTLFQLAALGGYSPAEIAEMLRGQGFDPVWKDWDVAFLNNSLPLP